MVGRACHHAAGLQGGLSGLCRRRLGNADRSRRIWRAGASDPSRQGGVEQCLAEGRADVGDGILVGWVQFGAGECAPRNRISDQVCSKGADGRFIRPPGFKEAYRAEVEGGWGTLAGPAEYGGQELPLSLASVVMEDRGSANMGFSLIMMLSPAAVEALKWHGTEEQRQT